MLHCKIKPLTIVVSGLLLSACGSDDSSSSSSKSADNKLVRSAEHPGVVCENVEMETRDGVVLKGLVYRADTESVTKAPTIVTRSPYSRLGTVSCFNDAAFGIADPIAYASSGYSYFLQHVRGTYNSEGTFTVLHQEHNDSYDAVEWAAQQPWSNGDIGVRGASYLGLTTWQSAISGSSKVKAAAIGISGESYQREWAHNYGIPHVSLNTSWLESTFVPDQIIRNEQAKDTDQATINKMVADRQALSASKMFSEWVWQLPLTSMDAFEEFEGLHTSYQNWLENPYYNDYWKEIDVREHINKVTYPVLIHNAWYDLFSNGGIKSYLSMKELAGSDAAKNGTKLLMSQYGHGANHKTPDFGAEISGPIRDGAINTQPEYPPWDMAYFDYYLKGEQNGYNDQADVSLAILVPPNEGQQGRSFTLESDQYPLANTTYTSFYLDSDGDANNRDGSGMLSTTPDNRSGSIPAESKVSAPSHAADLFAYDPANPVPTTGGNLCCSTDFIPGGPKSGAVEQAEIEQRDDVLVYTSAPLTEDMVLVGPVQVKLFAKSDSFDTDFMAKLVDLRPDGLSHNIVDGAVRARLRNGPKSQPVLIEPNHTYEYTIELGHVGTVFPAGHRIRLQISSSNFPRYARNLNTGASNETTAEFKVANQVILHDAEHQSRLILPVVSGVTIPAAE